jgi:hypothetical protein
MTEKNGVAERYGEGTRINLSREDALLIHCARLNLSPKRHEAIKDILAGGIDWDLLINKAAWHRLSPLLAHCLLSPGLSELIPMAILQRMRAIYYQSLARSIILQDELSRLLSIFQQEGIPVVALKGAALLESIYGDISLRPMGDLDILVRPEHLDRAEAIAFKQGYGFHVNHKIQELTRQNCRHLANLWHHEKGIMLEIHHHIVSQDEPYYFNLDGFWARAKPITISSTRALTLAPEDLLIHLSIKFLLDRRYRSSNALGQLCDISEVIRHYGDSLDWDLIEKTSQENGVLKGLHFVLYTCQRLLQTPVPASVLDRFQPQEFNPASAELFIRRRVLDTRPWLAHGLLDSQLAFSRRRMIRAIASRLSNFAKEIIKKNGNGDNTGPFNLRRVGDILPRLVRVLLRPAELKEDLQLDRWLHNLYNVN